MSMFSTDDFKSAIVRLMPTGPAWSRAPGGLISILAQAWASTFHRNSARAENLLIDSFPATATELLGEWERSLGLPDPCAGDNATAEQRRAQLLARLSDNGGSSIDYYEAFAKTLGFNITVQEYAPSRCGVLRSSDALQNEAWAYCWVVLHPGYTPIFARCGVSTSGEALMSWSNGPLLCELEARNPAHLILRFGQNGQNALNDFADDIQ